jgi:hypothetical protein
LKDSEQRDQVSRGAGVITGFPRMRRHQGVMIGMMKNNIATDVITPEIGRVKRIASDPCDMIRLWRNAFSAISPNTRANTSGAIG